MTFLVCIDFRRWHSKICLQYNYGNLDSVQCIRGPKWYDYNFPILNFSLLCGNMPSSPVYGVYISQLIRYSRPCGSCQDFLDRGLLLTRKLLHKGFPLVKLKSSLRKFYGRYHDLVNLYGIYVSQMTTNMFALS